MRATLCAMLCLLWSCHTKQETLKDARTATADMDDDAMSSGRQVARLRHALDGSQAALKAAQEDLAQASHRSSGGSWHR